MLILCESLHNVLVGHARRKVRFILIPKNQFLKEKQIINDPRIQHTGAKFSFFEPFATKRKH